MNARVEQLLILVGLILAVLLFGWIRGPRPERIDPEAEAIIEGVLRAVDSTSLEWPDTGRLPVSRPDPEAGLSDSIRE